MVRNHWLIQSSGIRRSDDAIRKLLTDIEAADCIWSDFGVLPFTNEITGWENIPLDRNVFVHCSVKVLEIFNSDAKATEIFPHAPSAFFLYDSIKEGLFYDKKRFDQAYYAEMPLDNGTLRELLLNGDCCVLPLHICLNTTYSEDLFVKPTSDLKLFTAGVLEKGKTLKEMLSEQTTDSRLESRRCYTVMFAPVRNDILAEYRFFVVNEAVCAGSQYRKDGQLAYSSDVPYSVWKYAGELAVLYQPAEAFVMDLAVLPNDDIKIVEYNCINCSGVYDADVTKLAMALRQIKRREF